LIDAAQPDMSNFISAIFAAVFSEVPSTGVAAKMLAAMVHDGLTN
jgi:hypothetical protein